MRSGLTFNFLERHVSHAISVCCRFGREDENAGVGAPSLEMGAMTGVVVSLALL